MDISRSTLVHRFWEIGTILQNPFGIADLEINLMVFFPLFSKNLSHKIWWKRKKSIVTWRNQTWCWLTCHKKTINPIIEHVEQPTLSQMSAPILPNSSPQNQLKYTVNAIIQNCYLIWIWTLYFGCSLKFTTHICASSIRALHNQYRGYNTGFTERYLGKCGITQN